MEKVSEEMSEIVTLNEFDVLSVQSEEIPSTSGKVLENPESQTCECECDEMYTKNPFVNIIFIHSFIRN